MKKNIFYGFTLAEILITLVIIGVISALTIPSVVVKYQKEQTVTKLKKAYNMLQKVIMLSEAENGPHKEWNYNLKSEPFFEKYLNKYFSYTKYSTQRSEDFINAKYWYHTNGMQITQDDHAITGREYPKLLLSNGMVMGIKTHWSGSYTNMLQIALDINGTKEPNVYGRDLFYFSMLPENTLLPKGFEYSRATIMNDGTFGCKKNSYAGGQYCAALIMKDGWKISDDYPWNSL